MSDYGHDDDVATGRRYRRAGWLCAGLTCVVMCAIAAGSAAADPEKPTTAVEGCRTGACHAPIGAHEVMHGPTAQDKCFACHVYEQPEEHTFKLVDAEAVLCVTCHALQHRTVVHQPVADGECTSCHDPHGSERRMMLVADATGALCAECHEDEGFAEKQFLHGPVAQGACILCHEPHSSWEPKLLVDEPETLCRTCHADVVPAGGPEARHVHEPVEQGCTTCHDPHASDVKGQLHEATPELCLSCHEAVRTELADAKVVHGVMSMPGGCLGCHTPHTSALPKLQRDTQRELCLSCHNRALQTAEGRTLTNMAALLKDNPEHHGPIRQGDCSTCHQPHAGERHNLLVQEYPPQFYASFTPERYALCFGCHQRELVEDKRGTGLTRFRKDDLNLHWLHVNQKKGRTCRACHEVHASRNPFHIRDAVPYGAKNWMLEIRYKQTPGGGSCAPGCHKPATYEHGEVDPVAPAEGAKG